MKQIGYYIMLAFRYRKKHPFQALYSILAIMVSVVLCYCSITVGFTIMNYGYEAAMIRQHGCEMELSEFPVGEHSIEGDDEWTPEEYRRMQKKVEKLPEVRETYLKKGYTETYDEEENITKEMYMILYVGAKDPSDLKKCAKKIEQDTGFQVVINSDIESYLGQGTAEDSMARTAGNAIVALVGAVFASFVMLVIRNTMMLPVLERMKEYGVLRCVGMSKGQLYFMLAAEGVMLTVLSTVLGTAAGFGILRGSQGWISRCLMTDVPVVFHFYPKAVLYSGILCIAVTLFALMEPARQAGKRSVQEVLRGGAYGLHNRKNKKKGERHYFSRLMGRIFGVEWEYAVRNMMRNPGSQLYLFVGIAISMLLFTIVFSAVETTYSTIENSMQGKNQEYAEAIGIAGQCSDELKQKICSDVKKLDGVEKVGICRLGVMQMPDFRQQKHIKADSKSICGWMTVVGYDRKHLNSLKKQVVLGKIDYDALIREKGVILCDYEYNQQDATGNVTRGDKRLTDYKVGDKIPVFTNEADKRMSSRFDDIKAAIGKEPERPEGEMELGHAGFVKEQKIEKKQRKYWRKSEKYLKKKGFPLEKYQWLIEKDGGKHISNASQLIQLLKQYEIDQGNALMLPIQAVIKEDIYNSLYLTQRSSSGIGVLMADETYETYCYCTDYHKDKGYKAITPGGNVKEYIGVKRNVREAGSDLADYVKKLNEENENIKFTLMEDSGGSGEYEWENETIANTNREMELLQKGGLSVGGFILIICLLQLINVTAAGMTMRQEEFRLLSVTGMSGKQLKKMLVLEKAVTCFLGICTGVAAGYGISYLFIELFLNQDGGIADGSGGICFTWPWGNILIIAVIVYILCLLCSYSGRRYNRKTAS